MLAGPPLPFSPVLQSPALPMGSLPSPRSFLLDKHLVLWDFTNSPSRPRPVFLGLALTDFGPPTMPSKALGASLELCVDGCMGGGMDNVMGR